MKTITAIGWNKVLRVKLAFLKLDNARLRKERNRFKRQLIELTHTGVTSEGFLLNNTNKVLNK